MTAIPTPRKVYYAAFVSYYLSKNFLFRLNLGFGNYKTVRIALNGFDEMNEDAYEWFTDTMLQKGSIVVEILNQDLKTGIYTANIYVDDMFVNQRMFDLGFAEPKLSS